MMDQVLILNPIETIGTCPMILCLSIRQISNSDKETQSIGSKTAAVQLAGATVVTPKSIVDRTKPIDNTKPDHHGSGHAHIKRSTNSLQTYPQP